MKFSSNRQEIEEQKCFTSNLHLSHYKTNIRKNAVVYRLRTVHQNGNEKQRYSNNGRARSLPVITFYLFKLKLPVA